MLIPILIAILTHADIDTVVASIGAMLTLLTVLIPKVRAAIADLYYIVTSFTPHKLKAWQNNITVSLAKNEKENTSSAQILNTCVDRVKRIEEAIYNGGNGIEARVIKTEIAVTEQFLDLPYPAFQCDLAGLNLMVSDAYLDLVCADHYDDLLSGKWRDRTVHCKDNDEYCNGFRDAASRGDDFIGVCSFSDPMTGEYRGKYRILLKAYKLNCSKNSAIYRGRFIMALDKRAAELVDEYRWKMRKDKSLAPTLF